MAHTHRNYSPSQVVKLFSTLKGPSFTETDLLEAEKQAQIPARSRNKKSWETSKLTGIGKNLGFLKAPKLLW